jgi:transposase
LIRLADFKARQLVFIDESGSDERTGNRRNGWAPKGCPLMVKELLKCTPRWSILPAYTIDGYITTVLFQGSINKERFEDFIIDFVLPQCTPFPGRNSVLVMDNCSVHRSEVIATACARAGVLIRFLPPYSPDFNPIEYSFHDLKAWIRRNWIHADEYTEFGQFLQEAICQNGGSANAIAHFGACNINIDGLSPIVV